MRNRAAILVLAASSVALLAGGGSAGAASGHRDGGAREVRMEDKCHPRTFNAAIGPGTCVGDGNVRFDELIEELLEDGEHGAWRFQSERFTVRVGTALRAENTGGEFHTFTEVRRFGGGCIPDINALLGLTPVAECRPEVAPGVPLAFVRTGAPAGGAVTVSGLEPGTHRFMCLIHPWMQSTVTVRR